MEASLEIKTDAGRNDYSIRLFYAAPDTLIFADERYRFSRVGYPTEAPWIREWRLARAWLHRRIRKGTSGLLS